MIYIIAIISVVGVLVATKATIELNNDFQFKKRAHKCKGVVTHKELVDEKRNLYETSVKFEFMGEENVLNCICDNYFVGGEFPILYNDLLGKIEFLEEMNAKRRKHFKDFGIGLGIVLVAYVLFIHHYEHTSLGETTILVLTTILAISLIYGGIIRLVKSYHYYRNKTLHQTKAKVIELIPEPIYDVYGGEGTYYYVLFEFVDEYGITKRMKSATGNSRNLLKIHVGDEVDIMYDMTTGLADKVNIIWEHILTWICSLLIGSGMLIYIICQLVKFFSWVSLR